MKYLGIDFGSKRVGLAISDQDARLAFPLKVLNNDSKLLDLLLKIIIEKEVEGIIIGESKNFKGEPNKIMIEIEKFKKILGEKTNLQIFFEPEFMSSRQAEILQGKNDMNDASAASIILQSFLDRKRV